jgi:hypothetical protein
MVQDITWSESPFGVVRGFTYGYAGTGADVFMPQVRELGAGMVRLFLFWGQMEPEPGHYVWDAVDTFLDQLEPSDEGWIMLGTSSLWATRRAAELLPPSPACDLDGYARFVSPLVRRGIGRVRYWQMDNEPHTPIFWQGTAQDYVNQLKVFRRTIKQTDPDAVVILGGAGGLFNPATAALSRMQAERDFFDHLMREGADCYDVFDLHLYGDPYTIPAEIATLRQKMTDLGYQKPIFVGEYNGPMVSLFKENRETIGLMMSNVNVVSAITAEDTQVRDAQWETEHNLMAELYARMETLPPQMQMFMEGCPPQWEELRHRINCRDLVMRNVLAFSAGVQKMVCFNLANEKTDHHHLFHLLFDKFKLMEYEDGVVKKRYPAAETLCRVTDKLAGVERVRRIDTPDRPTLYLFEVQRRERGSLLVVWERLDPFSGEDESPVSFEWSWDTPQARAVDAFGQNIPTEIKDGRLHLRVSLTPVFLEPTDGTV